MALIASSCVGLAATDFVVESIFDLRLGMADAVSVMGEAITSVGGFVSIDVSERSDVVDRELLVVNEPEFVFQ
jgi:hypothetical protein